MLGLPGEYLVKAHLPEGGKIRIKGLLIARQGGKVQIRAGVGEIRYSAIQGEYVEMKLYAPHWGATPFFPSNLDGRNEYNERDKYTEYL